jgi:hypothetical protein
MTFGSSIGVLAARNPDGIPEARILLLVVVPSATGTM